MPTRRESGSYRESGSIEDILLTHPFQGLYSHPVEWKSEHLNHITCSVAASTTPRDANESQFPQGAVGRQWDKIEYNTHQARRLKSLRSRDKALKMVFKAVTGMGSRLKP